MTSPRRSQARAGLESSRPGGWRETYDRLSNVSSLDGDDLDALADAAWWLGRGDESLAARRHAHARHAADDDRRGAAQAAWHLCYEHFFRGQPSIARGWLGKAERHLAGMPEAAEHGWLEVARSDLLAAAEDQEAALSAAQLARQIGERVGNRDLEAMGAQKAGRALIQLGSIAEGSALLDEAMISVIAGELSPLFTGWIFCDVLDACADIADLRRAAEWSDAARRWTQALTDGNAYFSGVCRVHRVEVANLRGEWRQAEAEAEEACRELLEFDPAVAGGAYAAAGELRRRMGDLQRAGECFARAAELGHDPQPGLALLRLARGDTRGAAAALRLALAGSSRSNPARVRLLAAQCEVAIAAGDLKTASAATEEVGRLAEKIGTDAVLGLAELARGRLALADGRPTTAFGHLRTALEAWQALGVPYETAQTRALLGQAMRLEGDATGAAAELAAARAEFSRLGARRELERLEGLVAGIDPGATTLSRRELQVLRLVAEGRSNREIAGELQISEHTVARHVSNLLTKLDVPSRAAATAYAYTHGLL